MSINLNNRTMSIRSNLLSTIENAVNNTKSDGRFHKADMKAITVQVNEIKNTLHTFRGPEDNHGLFVGVNSILSKAEGKQMQSDIATMKHTLLFQYSGMHDSKEKALNQLSEQIKMITAEK